MKVFIKSFGCPKNLVDSETIAGILSKNGYILCGEPEKADIIIINTCAFIARARKEAYTSINQISKNKSQYQKLIICGCLSQYEKSELLEKYPKIDAILGSSDFYKIMDVLKRLYDNPVLVSLRGETARPGERRGLAIGGWQSHEIASSVAQGDLLAMTDEIVPKTRFLPHGFPSGTSNPDKNREPRGCPTMDKKSTVSEHGAGSHKIVLSSENGFPPKTCGNDKAKKLGLSDNLPRNDIAKQPIKNTTKPVAEISTPKFIISNEPKLFSTPKSYAYIKIADGCNNRCSYCIIPDLRGNFRSRRIEHILSDVQNAVQSGRKEVILVAQDTTMYGIDIYKKFALNELLQKISKIDGLKWIRLLYTHPAHFTDELISEISENEKVCKYVDIPIQHTDDLILKKMGRPPVKIVFSTIEKLRKKIPDIALRTTVMVGFPGETDKSFTKLLNDIKMLEFDWLGGFVYSAQKGTAAHKMNNLVPLEVKKERLNEIMAVQQKITFFKNKKQVGKIFEVLADSEKYGHTEFQTPEIDGKVVFSSEQKTGSITKMKILKVKKVYDLVSC
ncbi:MAG: MiaB/RimO family radical SAM methylthiotransferase [Elusimicrobiota bacterium]